MMSERYENITHSSDAVRISPVRILFGNENANIQLKSLVLNVLC